MYQAVSIQLPIDNESFEYVSWSATRYSDSTFEIRVGGHPMPIGLTYVQIAAAQTLIGIEALVPVWVPRPPAQWLDSLGLGDQWRQLWRGPDGTTPLQAIKDTLRAHVDELVDVIAADLAYLQSRSEWDSEANFNTTEEIAGLGQLFGLPFGDDVATLRFYYAAAKELGCEPDVDEEFYVKDIDFPLDNPRCPECGGQAALATGVCVDCGHDILGINDDSRWEHIGELVIEPEGVEG